MQLDDDVTAKHALLATKYVLDDHVDKLSSGGDGCTQGCAPKDSENFGIELFGIFPKVSGRPF